MTLENVLSLNAVISLSNYYAQNRSTEENNKKEKFPELKNIDLGQISIGTWNMLSRETTRAMVSVPKAMFLSNIYELYHGSKSKEWENLSGTLISIRNKDAHGNQTISKVNSPDDCIIKFILMDDYIDVIDIRENDCIADAGMGVYYNGEYISEKIKQPKYVISYSFDRFFNNFKTAIINKEKEKTSDMIEFPIKGDITYNWIYVDGTEESHNKLTNACNYLWMCTGEMFNNQNEDLPLIEQGIIPDLNNIMPKWVDAVTKLSKKQD